MALKQSAKRLAAAALGPGLRGLADRVSRLERLCGASVQGETAIWWGTLANGRAARSDGSVDREAGAKYREELQYWVRARREPQRVGLDDFERVFAEWQGIRLAELKRFVGATSDEDFAAWRHRQAVVEIGSGPYPCVAATTWRRAVAVDPLADGYVGEGLPPSNAFMHHVLFVAAAGERVPLPAGSADLVICENTLDHVSDPRAVLLEVRRVLRPGGLLWLLVDLMEYADRMHPHSFSEPKLRGLIAECGFSARGERRDDHHSHPKAYGELRTLLVKPGGAEDLPGSQAGPRH